MCCEFSLPRNKNHSVIAVNVFYQKQPTMIPIQLYWLSVEMSATGRVFILKVKELKAFTSSRKQNDPHVHEDPPNDYTELILQHAEKLCRIYRALCEISNEVLPTAEREAATFARGEKNRRCKKRVATLLGGSAVAVTATAGVGTCVLLSVVAGVFTFGVGTVVGLSLTAAGAVAGGALFGSTGAAATGFTAFKYMRAEEVCHELKESCELVARTGSAVKLQFSGLYKKIQLIKAAVADVKYDRDHNGIPKYSLARLEEIITQLYADLIPAENALNVFNQVLHIPDQQ